LNAANEYFVKKFKNNEIKFNEIIKKIEQCLSMMPIKKVKTIEEIYEIDRLTRNLCHTL
jgi:1-deoxy-D-xylulose 5-phosphate reductoisomerase